MEYFKNRVLLLLRFYLILIYCVTRLEKIFSLLISNRINPNISLECVTI